MNIRSNKLLMENINIYIYKYFKIEEQYKTNVVEIFFKWINLLHNKNDIIDNIINSINYTCDKNEFRNIIEIIYDNVIDNC